MWKVLSPSSERWSQEGWADPRAQRLKKELKKHLQTNVFQHHLSRIWGADHLYLKNCLKRKSTLLRQKRMEGGGGGRGCEQRTKWLALQTAARCPAQERKACVLLGWMSQPRREGRERTCCHSRHSPSSQQGPVWPRHQQVSRKKMELEQGKYTKVENSRSRATY